jgi:hypothetical protein
MLKWGVLCFVLILEGNTWDEIEGMGQECGGHVPHMRQMRFVVKP